MVLQQASNSPALPPVGLGKTKHTYSWLLKDTVSVRFGELRKGKRLQGKNKHNRQRTAKSMFLVGKLHFSH